jgi:hypothetical protein
LGEERGSPRYPDHSVLLVYRDAGGAQHPVRGPADWAIRRGHILRGMEAAMGPLPDRSRRGPPEWNVAERVAGDGFMRLKVWYAAEPGDRVPAYLLLPAAPPGHLAAERRPAMLALHQTTAIGKGEVVGLGGGRELAQRGYVVLAPDYPSFGDYAYDFHNRRYVSGSMKGIFNHMRGVDLLESLPEVDPRRIGVIGHSLGGHNAMFVGVFDSRLAVIVASCGWNPLHDYFGGRLIGWTSDRYMPRLRDVYGLDPDRVPFDFYEVVAALAPRTFFSNSPTGDDNFAVGGVRKAEAKAREVFALWGAGDHLQIRYPDCGHDFPPEVRRAAYAAIDRTLRHTPTRQVP